MNFLIILPSSKVWCHQRLVIIIKDVDSKDLKYWKLTGVVTISSISKPIISGQLYPLKECNDRNKVASQLVICYMHYNSCGQTKHELSSYSVIVQCLIAEWANEISLKHLHSSHSTSKGKRQNYRAVTVWHQFCHQKCSMCRNQFKMEFGWYRRFVFGWYTAN